MLQYVFYILSKTWDYYNKNFTVIFILSFDVDETLASYSWNFGDGAAASGMTASHVYGADGGYTVTLTVTDYEGRTGSTSYLVKTRPVIGVIRWDAWVGDLASYGQEIEVTLSPNHWHYRLPFYGVELGPDLVQARCTTQDVVDQEIAYAKAGGIDYFAFLTYDEDIPLSLGIKLYLSSTHKTDVNFCVIMPQQNQIQDTSTWNSWITRFAIV